MLVIIRSSVVYNGGGKWCVIDPFNDKVVFGPKEYSDCDTYIKRVEELEELKVSEARGLIDSEYDVLTGFGHDDLFDYLSSHFGNFKRSKSDMLFNEYFGG